MKSAKQTLAAGFLLLSLLAPAGEAKAVEPDFKVYGGDILHITVWKEEGLDRETLVLPDGTLTFPLIGTIKVAGKTPAEIQQLVKEDLKDKIPDASVTVAIKAPTGHTVSVLGQVAKPGEIVMSHTTTVTEALSQVGGLTPYAEESGIIVIRKKGKEKQKIEIPYDDIADGEKLDQDIELEPGDVIMVPTAGLL